MSLSRYADTFERFAADLPDRDRAARRLQLDRFLVSGFPSRELEDWRYTDLSALDERSFALADQPAIGKPGIDRLIAGLLDDAEHLVFIDGHLSAAHSTATHRHASSEITTTDNVGVIALNAAFASGGLNLRLARDEILPKPLQMLACAGGEHDAATMSHQHHRIELGEHAQATVLLQFSGQGTDHLSTHVVDVTLAAGARLTLYRLQDDAAANSLVVQLNIRQARDSQINAVTVDLGNGLARHDFDVDLAEPGAEANVAGLYVPRRGAHVDNHLRITHRAAHCRSRMSYRGIIDERARAVFNGKVVVKPGAQKTDSEQRIANLLLSRKAEVNAKPELEIYADDVKCAHGATVGQLDQAALAYLRSRGIPLTSARALLLRAFAMQILDRIEWPALRQRIETALQLPTEMPEAIAS